MSQAVDIDLALTQKIEWLGISLAVPLDWELVRHSLKAEQGSLHFVDRRRDRLVVSWTQTKSPPDLQRLVSDFRSQELGRDRKSGVETYRLGQRWRGIRQRRAATASGPGESPELLTRAVCFDQTSSRLIEAAVVSPRDDKQERRLVERILGELRVQAPAAEARSWRAFGLAVTTPANFRLVKADVKPADVTFGFLQHEPDSKTTRVEASARRLGMAGVWFDGDLRRVLTTHAPKVRFSRFTEMTHQGYDAVFAEGLEPGPLLGRWLGRLRRHRALIWSVVAENAVYEVVTLSPLKRPVEPRGFEISAGQGVA